MLLNKLRLLVHTHDNIVLLRYSNGNVLIQKQNYYYGNRKSPVNQNDAEITKGSITNFLRQQKIQFQEGPTCIRCINPFMKGNHPTCYINMENGFFTSTNSHHKGTWKEFKGAVFGEKELNKNIESKHLMKEVEDKWKQTIKFKDIPPKKMNKITKNINFLPLQEFKKYDIRLSSDYNSLLIPWYKDVTQKTLLGLKKISIDSSDEKTETCLPHDDYYHVFGLDTAMRCKKVVVTSSVFDTFTLNSLKHNIKAVCLPYGSTRLPLEVLPYFEQFTELIIWFDMFEWDDALRMAKKFGVSRCKVIRPNNDIPNPTAAVLSGQNILEMVSRSVPAEVKNIVSFKDLAGLVKSEILNNERSSGVKWQRFSKLTQKLKGHRRGELTILTGPTGCGKTTFLCEYSLDLAMSGVSTLWGSFEISNTRLLTTLLAQYAKQKLVHTDMNHFNKTSNEFKKVPIHLMTYSGNNNVRDVLMTMKQAAYMHDVSHIILDNLQFMMGSESMIERFNSQDNAISEFRKFATKENIHITLVIHPRKEDSNLPLQMSSVFGGAKATQEADNVLILQSFEQPQPYGASSNIRRRYLEIVKNRFCGELGTMQLHFNKNSLCMSEPVSKEFEVSEQTMRPVKKEHLDKI